jgi:hypothetical protein
MEELLASFSFLDRKDTAKIRKSKKLTDKFKMGKKMFDQAMTVWMTQMILNERRQAEMLVTIMAVAMSSKLLTPELRNELNQNITQIRQQFVGPLSGNAPPVDEPEDLTVEQDEIDSSVEFLF